MSHVFTVMLFMHLLKSQIAALNTKVVNFEAYIVHCNVLKPGIRCKLVF